MTDFDNVRKRASLAARTVSLCLAGGLAEEHARLERQLEGAQPPATLGEASPKRLIAEQILAIEAEMRESTVDFHLRAMPTREWTKFWASMPTRKDDETDDEWDERLFAFYAEMVSRSCTDPAMSIEQAGELADLLHASAWNRLVSNCMGLNMGTVNVPNSAAASDLIGNSETT